MGPAVLKTKQVRAITEMLDSIVERYKLERPVPKRDWRTYEQRLMMRIKGAICELEPLVEEATRVIRVARPRGRKPELTLKQRVILLLLKHLFDRSNREMSLQLFAFSLLSGVDVSYKTVERLYSDREVLLALGNLHALALKRKGVRDADCSGDGTGYSLSIRRHYATAVKRRRGAKRNPKGKRWFVYSFALMDLGSRMYVGYGTSFKSEKEAFLKAVRMAREAGVRRLRLDKYYSTQCYVELLEKEFGDLEIYLIPKRNATVRGPWVWKQTLKRFVEDPQGYLREYYQRNQSESAISEDKRRFGWRVAQRREDRVDTAVFCTTVWHNLFWLK